jgi:predicted metal-binding protein
MVRTVYENVPQDMIENDLERYRRLALEFGATEAKVITTDQIFIDERAQAKCRHPKCAGYGTNANCPPYGMDTEETRRLVSRFRYAVFFKIEAPPEDQEKLDRAIKVQTTDIVSRIESAAFYDSYYFAVGFAGTGCKNVLCPDVECSALQPGKGCRYPFRARAAMHAVGMDAYRMATHVGWEMRPVGPSSPFAELPYVCTMGIVLIY